jgi:hypothetical protein
VSADHFQRVFAALHEAVASAAVHMKVNEARDENLIRELTLLKFLFLELHIRAPADLEDLLPFDTHDSIRDYSFWSDDFSGKYGYSRGLYHRILLSKNPR